ncbi:MAG: alpha/beta hydrolase, partial [Cyanobacteria bacterium]|nr:alpha/beta hydrolase [Cyanobacteriota bacterium]
MTRTTAFETKPIPWMYSQFGSMLAIAMMKLVPIHRRLTELEMKNIQDYFNSDFVSQERRKKIGPIAAFWMAYWGAIQRITQVSKSARQDYYALNRQGSFAVEEMPVFDRPQHPGSAELPLLIVPGLNTPPMFFREMYHYFIQKGFNVSVMHLPHRGLADVAHSAEALKSEIEKMKDRCEVSQINVVGHCLGGLIAQYCLESLEKAEGTPSMKNLVSLGTGFLGAEGVEVLKNVWIPNHPGKPIPKVFDELIQWNLNIAKKSQQVAYHSLLTIWDFMVFYRKGLLEAIDGGVVTNQIIEDPAIDHLTIALNHKIFDNIANILISDRL